MKFPKILVAGKNNTHTGPGRSGLNTIIFQGKWWGIRDFGVKYRVFRQPRSQPQGGMNTDLQDGHVGLNPSADSHWLHIQGASYWSLWASFFSSVKWGNSPSFLGCSNNHTGCESNSQLSAQMFNKAQPYAISSDPKSPCLAEVEGLQSEMGRCGWKQSWGTSFIHSLIQSSIHSFNICFSDADHVPGSIWAGWWNCGNVWRKMFLSFRIEGRNFHLKWCAVWALFQTYPRWTETDGATNEVG